MGNEVVYFLQIYTKVFYKVIVSFWCAKPGTPKVPKITSFQYLKENGKNELDFFLQINIKDFFKFILSF